MIMKKGDKKNQPYLLRGFKDTLPEENIYWNRLRRVASEILFDYCFGEISTPLLEPTTLFRRTIGEHTDIVSKEMFTFTDQSRTSVTMRPEMTASIARAYIEHGLLNRPQPVKVFQFGPAFRYDRPQAGRFRQFHQLDIEILGEAKPVADAEIIFLSHLICRQLGLNVIIHVNSLGDRESRQEYIKVLKEYYRSKRRHLCENCKTRLNKNLLRLLDCKEEHCHSLAESAPQIIDHLDEESKEHFVKVLEYLDEAEVPYLLNPLIVRGLDYYNRTAFEILPVEPPAGPEGAAKPGQALGGGGRYDSLIEQIGGRPTAAVGVAFGLERVVDLIKKENQEFIAPQKADVFLAQLGEKASKYVFKLFEKLRQSGLALSADFSSEGLKSQLETADKLKVAYTVILGQKELIDGTIIIRDMESGIQEMVDLDKIVEELKKRLRRG